MNNKINNNASEYDLLRVIGTVLVVMGHSAYATMLTETGGIVVDTSFAKSQDIISLIVRLIYSFHMPMFVALSGALYNHTNAYTRSISKFVNSKLKRLLIPFLLTSFLWAIPIKLISGYWENSTDPIKDIFIGQVVLFDNNYLWYVVSLFWIFLMMQLIRRITEKEYVLLTICIVLFCIGQLFTYNYLGLQKAFTHIIFFELGAIYDKNSERIHKLIESKLLQIVILGISITVYLIYLKFLKNNVYFYALVAVAGVSIIYVITWYIAKTKVCENGIYKNILRYSFEIYLISDPLNYLYIFILKAFQMEYLYSNNLFCIVFFIGRIVASVVISVLIAKMLTLVKMERG